MIFSGRTHLSILTLVLMNICTMYSQSNWTIFRGSQNLSGFTTSEIPISLDVDWVYSTDAEIKSSPVVFNNRIVIGSTDGFVYCLNLTGKLVWRFNTGNAIEAPALIHEGNVYIGNLGGRFICLDLNKGSLKWEYKTDNQIMGSPNWWEKDGKTRIIFGSYDYFLHCVDASTGSMIWKYESDNFLNGAAAVEEDHAIFGGCDGFLHMVNTHTGNADAKIEVATYVAGSAAIDHQKAYIGDYDGKFSCVDLQKKSISWQWKDQNNHLPFIASPSIYKNQVIIGNENKILYCFDKRNGNLLWKTNTGSKVDASCVINDQRVLAVNMRGDVMVLNLKNGELLLTYETGSAIMSNPAVSNGKIYFGAQDGKIYCLGN